jgi:8-oxo-dGTP diphosphatase
MKLFIGTKALVMHKGKVLVLREAAYDEGTNTGKWDVPGSRINPEEPLHTGLLREVREESGLGVIPGPVLGVFETFPTIKGEECHIVRIYYKCESNTDVVTLSNDHDAYEWIDPCEYSPRAFVTDIEEMLKKVTENQ